MLRAEKISLNINGAVLLNDIDLDIASGSVTAIMGPNGAGKTSLLRVLTGELSPTQGQVFFNQKPLEEWVASEKAAAMSVLAQSPQLNFPFTAEEVVALGRTPHSSGLVRDKEIIAEALQLVDCEYLRHRIYTQLSGGEKQRVQFARVLAQIWEPVAGQGQLLVLDEPTASFDLAHQKMMLDTIAYLSKKNISVLIVLHDINLAINCADQLVLIGCGEIQAKGEPSKVLSKDVVRQVFGADVDIVAHPTTGRPVVIPL